MSRDAATRSEAAVPENETLVKEEPAEEQPPTYHQLQPVARSPGPEVLPRGMEVEEEEQEEMLVVSDKLRTLQAVSSRKAEIVATLSVLEQRKLKLRQELELVEREEGQLHEEVRALTSQELRSLASEHADASPTRGFKRKAPGSTSAQQATPKRAYMPASKATVTFKQLRDYVDDMKQQGVKRSASQDCPVCTVKKQSFSHLVRHLYEHLPTKEHYFYKCPFDGCDYRAVRLERVKEHVPTRLHNAAWTDDMKDRCVVQNNLDCFTDLCR
ncbi:hypothetical protein AAVH_19528 [Aphelenchoides avenae]|nr:hypothetical protein AAVH_19528 [Aphelenchus avenae]